MTVNFIELERMAEIATRRGVVMEAWFNTPATDKMYTTLRVDHPCGTVGCLVGSWICETPSFAPEVKTDGDLYISYKGNNYNSPLLCVKTTLGLNTAEFDWLFTSGRIVFSMNGEEAVTNIKQRYLRATTTEQAVSRLNKFIEYKKIKAQVFKEWNDRLHTRGLECKSPDAANKVLLSLAS